ncbi:exported hypothetical protein [Candidatus Zixiibacteriota bacterium]|nr:exported hypothetical protein [candidate division Zixibacteria bacterium]
MKRLIILSIAIFLLAFTGSFATMTRVLTMGDANGIVHDEANIWFFPQTLYDYPDIVVGEFYESYYGEYNNSEFTDFGVHYKFGEKKPFVLGLYFTKNQPYEIPGGPVDWNFDVMPNNRMDLFYSRMIGNHKFGFHLNYIHGNTKYETDSTTNWPNLDKRKEGINNYAFEFGLTPNNGKLDLAAGISFLSWTQQDRWGKDESKPDGNLNVNFLARYFHEVNQKITWVPYAGLMYEKVGAKYFLDSEAGPFTDTIYAKYSVKYTTAVIGVGLNYSPAAGVLAIGDVGIMFDNSHYLSTPVLDTTQRITEQKYDYTTIPYFRVGIDATVLKWVDLRAGATSYWENYKNQTDYTRHNPYTTKYKQSYVYNETYLGAGLHWGNFFADLYVDPMLITDGPYFLSGNSTDWSYQVSLKYKMF